MKATVQQSNISCVRKRHLLGGLLLFLVGCGTPPKEQQAKLDKPKQEEPEVEKIEDLKGAVTGKGWHIPWKERDPNNPKKALPVMIADADTGAMKNDDGNVRIQLHRVKARLFREGKPTAYVEAQQISANRKDKVVVGMGNVIVNSLSDPPDTVIKADKMKWDTRSSVIVAIGNARVTRRMPNGQLATSLSDRVTFDTKLKDFVLE